ncbi:MAG: hypothetical protein HIU90_16050 [Proteobacteria bacterium]|nr:hypothetical protein [Pseudomonadota bacterium]
MNAALPTGPSGRALAAGLVVVAIGISWLAIARPLIGWYDARAATLAERVEFADRLAARAATLPALAAAARGMSPAPRTGYRLLNGSTDAIAAASLQQIVQGLATHNGVTISSAETLAPATVGHYLRIRLRVAVSGRWAVLVRLLTAIAAQPPIMMIDDLRLNAGEHAPTIATTPLTVLFTLIAFRARTSHLSAARFSSTDVVK